MITVHQEPYSGWLHRRPEHLEGLRCCRLIQADAVVHIPAKQLLRQVLVLYHCQLQCVALEARPAAARRHTVVVAMALARGIYTFTKTHCIGRLSTGH